MAKELKSMREVWPEKANFEKVILQLNKDFGEDVFEMDLAKGAEPLQQMLVSVSTLVEVLLEKNMSKLLRWCYRIDLPQERFDVLLKPENTGNVAEELAVLILLREAQKIALRETWSQKRTIDGTSSQSS
jgi:hypothetical protein